MNKYNFTLPQELIAQQPAHPRDSARLLVYKLADGSIADAVFRDIDQFLPTYSTIAVNNSKVEQCRWLFDDARTELFVLEKNDPHTIRALVRPGKKFRVGNTVRMTPWLSVETLAVSSSGERTLRLSTTHDDPRLAAYEHIPLPPYIAQDDTLADEYQTVYAKPTGSLAAPTAGLHFTDSLLADLKQRHAFAEVTLHVGLGTFAKLTDENIRTGKLHSEHFLLDKTAVDTIGDAQHITAVGTTTIRTLETYAARQESFGETDIFIRPGYIFKRVDAVVTNFHLPDTSLLMLIAAFIADKKGLDEKAAAAELMRIYQHAINNHYRFYSFGDAMLLV